MIRAARITDFGAINQLRNKLMLNLGKMSDANYRVSIQQSGFLLPLEELSLKKYEKNLPDYIIPEYKGNFAGFLHFDEKQGMDSKLKVTWLQPKLKAVYFSQPHAYISSIAVTPEAAGHGLGTVMVQAAEQRARTINAPYLFSFVVTAPVTNFPSMMLHEKNGFERIAVLDPQPLFGMENYQSILYAKPIK